MSNIKKTSNPPPASSSDASAISQLMSSSPPSRPKEGQHKPYPLHLQVAKGMAAAGADVLCAFPPARWTIIQQTANVSTRDAIKRAMGSGVRGLYRGAAPTFAMKFANLTALFVAKETLQPVIDAAFGDHKAGAGIAGGAAAGAVQAVVATPLERMQVILGTTKATQYRNCFSVVTTLVAQPHGLRELYRGLTSVFTARSCIAGVYFGLDGVLHNWARKDSKPTVLSEAIAIAGPAVAAAATQTALFPLYTAKANLLRTVGGPFVNPAAAIKFIADSRGVGGLYCGASTNVVRVFISWTAVSSVRELFDRQQKKWARGH